MKYTQYVACSSGHTLKVWVWRIFLCVQFVALSCVLKDDSAYKLFQDYQGRCLDFFPRALNDLCGVQQVCLYYRNESSAAHRV
jgi:sensor histidine kinase YesM